MPLRLSRAAFAAALVVLLSATTPAQDDTWRLAMGLLQRGLHDEAAAQLRTFLKRAPRDPRVGEAHYRLGVCEAERGRDAAAVAEFEAALTDRSLELRPECLYRLGGALQRLGRHADARRRYEALVEELKGSDHYLLAAASFGAGEAARDAGDDPAAAQHFLRTGEVADAEDASGYRFAGLYQGGFALLRSGQNDAAAQVLEKLAEQFPDHESRPEVLHLLGEACFRAGRLEHAEKAWELAVRAGGEFADDARSGIGWARRRRGDTDGALAAFRELAEHHPNSPLVPAARIEAARVLLEKQDAAAAAREVEAVANDTRLDAAQRRTALEVLGLAWLETGRGDEARAVLERALDGAAPADAARLHHAIGECHAAAGRWAEALTSYGAAAASEDVALRGDAIYGSVLALHALGRHTDSLQIAADFERHAPGHRLAPYAAFAVAENLFALGRHAEARRAFLALSKDHPLATDARSKAAWCAWLADDAKAAARAFEAVAGDEQQPADRREEALSMAALAALTAGEPDRALALADTYAGRHPQGAHLARTERVAARVLRERGDLTAAAERLRRAGRAGAGDDPSLELERADVLLAGGDFEAASRAFAAHADRDDAHGARAIEGLAWCAFELGDDQACLRWIDAGVRHPAAGEIAPSLRELAVTVHHRAERWSEAAAAAQAFLAAHRDHARAPEVRYALGVAQSRGGDAETARTTLEALLEDGGVQRPDLLLYELGWAAKRAGATERAREAFAEVADTKGADAELADESRVRAAEIDLEADERERARTLLLKVEHPRQVGRARYLVGQSWLADGDLQRARAAFDAVVALGEDEPLFTDALYAAGETAQRAGDHAAAVERLERMIAAAPGHASALRARLLLGESLVREGRSADAVGQLEAFLAGADGEESAVRARGHLWLGRALAARDQHASAEAAYAKATELSEGEIAAEASYRIGEVRREAGDLAGAAEAFVRVSILFAHDEWVPKGLLEAGRAFEQLGQHEKALRLWTELVERYAKSAEARQIRDRVRER